MNESLFYRCEKSGDILALIKSGGAPPKCCGEDMTNLVANSTDAAKEKHVPVIIREGAKIKVSVGSVLHPMTADHFIEWIALVTDDKLDVVHLKPGKEPKAEFIYYSGQSEIPFTGKDDEIVPNCEGQPCNFVYSDKSTNKITIYAFCNLHGLWKAEL